METPESLIPEHGLTLTRRDLVDFEPLIAREIASFLPFKAHSLYFPKSFTNHTGALSDLEQGMAVYLAQEKKVLLPLMPHGELIGVFVARGVALKAPKPCPRIFRVWRGCAWKNCSFTRPGSRTRKPGFPAGTIS